MVVSLWATIGSLCSSRTDDAAPRNGFKDPGIVSTLATRPSKATPKRSQGVMFFHYKL